MAVELSETWEIPDGSYDLISLFISLDEAFDTFLGAYSQKYRPNYLIFAKNGSVDRTDRSELKSAVDSLGGPLEMVAASYAQQLMHPEYTGRSVRISLGQFSGLLRIYLKVQGNDEEIARGQYQILCNQITAELKRMTPSSKVKLKVPLNPAETPSMEKSKNYIPQHLEKSSKRFSILAKILKHPISSGLIVLIVGSLILKLFGVI